MDGIVEGADGRSIGFATYGRSDGTPVVWCHGGPGSRMEPAHLRDEAAEADLLLVGIDRPGYGNSTPNPGRTIAGWLFDALAVVDDLGLGSFFTVGVSTGGAYALALAALVPRRVLGVVACCSMTDMRWEEARCTMSRPHCHDVWDAPDRESALAAAEFAHGKRGSKLRGDGIREVLAPSDAALFRDPAWIRDAEAAFSTMFAQGLIGYTDDRLADGGGWTTFDVTAISCPVTVLHGRMDKMCHESNALHTAEIVPNARLDLYDDLGHFSIETKVVPVISHMLAGL
ncbi:MAG: alpha/beta fold hydrolase [Acidimicrobiales bacterium]